MRKFDKEFLEANDSIYSLIPAYLSLTSSPQKVNFIYKAKVREYFFKHQGKKNAKPLNDIARELGFSKSGNSVRFRTVVARLIEKEFFPVVSCVKGYYMAETISEISHNINTENNRIKGIERRRDALLHIRDLFEKSQENMKQYIK